MCLVYKGLFFLGSSRRPSPISTCYRVSRKTLKILGQENRECLFSIIEINIALKLEMQSTLCFLFLEQERKTQRWER